MPAYLHFIFEVGRIKPSRAHLSFDKASEKIKFSSPLSLLAQYYFPVSDCEWKREELTKNAQALLSCFQGGGGKVFAEEFLVQSSLPNDLTFSTVPDIALSFEFFPKFFFRPGFAHRRG